MWLGDVEIAFIIIDIYVSGMVSKEIIFFVGNL